MKKLILPSIIYNLLFFIVTAVLCFAYIPLLILPRSLFIRAVEMWAHIVAFLERSILGLRCEIRGLEHLPHDGPYIVAAKHQSTYETFKLHLLFKDPAIILKRELLRIPLWGAYLWKSDVIAIDRSTPKTANYSIKEGALRMKAQGRPIVIFPQGTRVAPETTTAEKPYKQGVATIQQTTELPIIPLALNTGSFCPKGSFFKSGGTVIFEFLEPIQPGKDKAEVLRILEQQIENTSSRLMNEARISATGEIMHSGAESTKPPPSKKPNAIGAWILFGFALVLFGLYSVAWFQVAKLTRQNYDDFLYELTAERERPIRMRISGYPGPIQADVREETIENENGFVRIENLHADIWPIPGVPARIQTGTVTIQDFTWLNPIVFDSVEASVVVIGQQVNLTDSTITHGGFNGKISGTVNTKQKPVPELDLVIAMENHQYLLSTLANNGIIEDRMALFMGAGFSALANEEGIVEVPLVQRGSTLYAGPLAIADIPPTQAINSALP